jgi:4-aminobutyrate aminotransferase-like enzyme/Ser/Thr protein kinase RdoA (MazF antagonist)
LRRREKGGHLPGVSAESASRTPRLSTAEAEALALRLLGRPASLEPLPADRDRNYRVVANDGEELVLKIFREGEDPGLLACQDEVMERLAGAGLPYRFPRVRPTVRGERLARVEGSGGAVHHVRLVEWVPGTLLARARPHKAELLEELGALLGAVGRVLEGYRHPSAERRFEWDLREAGGVVAEGVRAADGGRAGRAVLLKRFLGHWRDRVMPSAVRLPTAVIHGDANDYNVLVEAGSPPDPVRPLRVAGLLDFGDLVHSWRVGEAAVGAAYALLGRADPVAAVAVIARGHHRVQPLEEAELDVLFPLACLRLCVSVVHSSRRAAEEPDNAYLTVSAAPAWEALERLAAVDPDLARYRIRAACGLPPSPAAARAAARLRDDPPEVGPVLGGDHPRRPRRVLDLWVGGSGGGTLTDAPAGAHGLPGALARHDEARWVSRDLPSVPADPVAEPASVHLGLELFAAPGTPVLAPLAGRVEAVSGTSLLLLHDLGEGILLHTRIRGVDPASSAGREVARGERLGEVAGDRIHLQLLADRVEAPLEIPSRVAPGVREMWRAVSPDPNLLLRLSEIPARREGLAAEEILGARRRRLGPGLSVAYRRPLHIVRGRMQHLWDAEGRDFLDAVNNVAHVGHEHPRVVEALRAQAGVLNTNTRYLHESLVRYAERLAATLPGSLDVCYLVCSGSEANELALRLARAHTGRRDVIVLEGAYHGNTTSLVAMSPYKYRGPGGGGPAPWVHEAPLPDPYRGLHRGNDPEAGRRYAAHVGEAMARAREAGTPVAAFFCEPLPGCGGQVVPPSGFLREAFLHVREGGGVCVADEVQTGLGRVGSHTWAFEAQGAVPDVVTLGKPLGNGHPLAAVVTTREIADSFETGMEYFNTFGGNPVSAAVGLAVLDVIEQEGLRAHADRLGRRLLRELAGLADDHPLVGDVRGMGMFLGVELVRDRETREPAPAHAGYVAERMRDHRILLSTDGPDANVLKIKPPLAFGDADADRLVETLRRILGEDPVRVD